MFASDVLVYRIMALPIRPLYGYTLWYISFIQYNTSAPDMALFFYPKVLIYFLFLRKNICLVLIRSASVRHALMSTHNICLHGEIRKIFSWYLLLSGTVNIIGQVLTFQSIYGEGCTCILTTWAKMLLRSTVITLNIGTDRPEQKV